MQPDLSNAIQYIEFYNSRDIRTALRGAPASAGWLAGGDSTGSLYMLEGESIPLVLPTTTLLYSV
jgi:hypothetical protein